jgi:hypothetical protein
MTNNIFQFGDTYWLQIDATAMGVSPSCVYATIYFSAFEDHLRSNFPEMIFYKRYIDDVLIIWQPTDYNDTQRYKNFQDDFNNFGKLRWIFTSRDKETNFLDLTITINSASQLEARLYEKPVNLYLYPPVTSSHPKMNLKGLIYGMVYRTLRLTSCDIQQRKELYRLYLRLNARGHNKHHILYIINDAYQRLKDNNLLYSKQAIQLPLNVCFFHNSYHPHNPTSSAIQRLFDNIINTPTNCIPLCDMKNHKNCMININKLIVAYHRTPNVGNILSSRIMKNNDGPLVSSYLE